MEGLHAYAAGAGTGKTYQICEDIADAIRGGTDPARVIATTFTDRAAAELKERVLKRLWADEEIDAGEKTRLAERLELAATGTVHSVARQLLERYAFQVGLSPRLEILDRDDAERHLDRLLTESDPGPWEELADLGHRLDSPDAKALAVELLNEKRTNRISDDAFLVQMEESAERLCEILHPDGPDPTVGGPGDLARLAGDAFDRVSQVEDTTNTTGNALKKLRRLRNLRTPTWQDVVKARKLSAGTRSGADAHLADIRSWAANVRRMPQLHADVRAYTRALAEQVLALEEAYDAYKVSRGLLDFTDLEVFLLRALDDEDIRRDIGASYDVVFVDEFQDSNPVQLGIFLKLHEAIGRSYWVGDEKQSIYLFRDADLRLARAAWGLVPQGNLKDLDTSYRSQASLVRVLNELFVPLYGEDARLDADRDATDPALERWVFDVKNFGQEYQAVARGVEELHDEGIPYGDIGLLTHLNYHAAEFGHALAERGIPSVVERAGLLDTRECAIALAGLQLVTDRYDSLAAATILHLFGDSTEESPTWLLERLKAKREERGRGEDHGSKPWPDHPDLEQLEAIDTASRTPSVVLEEVVQVLDLPRHAAAWGTPERRLANLDALVQFARDYEEEREQEGRGASLRGLITWLDDLRSGTDREDEISTPEGLDAVTISTYHGSKGAEWPLVILTDLGRTKDATRDMWKPRVNGGHAGEGRPLEDRRLQFWLWPFGTYSYGGPPKRTNGTGLREAAVESAEGQELQERVDAESQRLLYVAMTRARDRLVLAHRGTPGGPANEDKYAWLAPVDIDDLLPPTLPAGDHELEDVDATGRIRHLAPPDDDDHPAPDGPAEAPALVEPDLPEVEKVPRYTSPSGAEAVDVNVEAEPLPGPALDRGAVRTEDWDALGDAVHAYLAALPSLRGKDRGEKTSVAERCLHHYRMEGALPAGDLVDAGDCLEAWVEETYPGATWHVEVPVTAPREDGSQWVGNIDLVLELPDGDLVVVDHKSRPIPEGMWEDEAREHAGQVRAYAQTLEASGESVVGTWVHFALGGGMVCLRDV